VAWIVHTLSPDAPATRWLFGAALLATFPADIARLRSNRLNLLFFRAFAPLASPREVEHLSLTWFLLGVFLVLLMPPEVAVPSILVVAVADPAASAIGRLWGTRPFGKGTLEGTAAFFLTADLVLIPFVGVPTALATAAVAAAIEALPIGLDDNLLVPVGTATCLWAALAVI
jgi:dolichol kinase